MYQQEPLVSVVIPSLNQARFIDETIQSVVLQSYPRLDILVVDGGSTDGTVDVLRKYDGAIRWISEPDHGHADAVNKGFRLAQGEIIGWLNSDDVYFQRDSVGIAVEAFNSHADADVIYGDAAKISEDSTILRLYFTLPHNRQRMLRANQITQPAIFIRKKIAVAEKLENYLSLDYEYWLRLQDKGYRFHHVPALLAGDRQYRSRASISRRSTLKAEITGYLDFYGASPAGRRLSRLLDRSLQATCRLRGMWFIFSIMLARNYLDRLAFAAKIDSFPRLFYRQMFKNVIQVF
jgi:glycosyltransferase involved in cell wall biosynthesis